jgi:serine/threonine protein kinase/formylglycine-generating enzyme required for sulfatase activity
MSQPDHPPESRLEAAHRLFLAYTESQGAEPADRFLERHRDLRDLLEPMLRGSSRLTDRFVALPGDRPPALDADPDCIGPYQIQAEIGRGGHGIVYRAEDLRLHRPVALKVLNAAAARSPRMRARLKREAEIASRLDHPAICAVYEVGDHRGLPYLAMRYVEGVSLAELLARARQGEHPDRDEPPADSGAFFSPAAPPASGGPGYPVAPGPPRTRAAVHETLHRIERIARALHAAHERGLVHRDVKPGNIMITPAGDPVLLDFGLARDTAGGFTLTGPDEILGTPAYLAPEQVATDRGPVDARTDVYALGVTLYECLTLGHPFEAAKLDQLYHQILDQEAPRVRRANPRLPADLDTVVATALEKRPVDRYCSAEALAEDLRRVRAHEPILARPPGPLTRARKFVRRHRVVVTATVLVILALGTGLGVSLWQQDKLARANEQIARQLDFALSASLEVEADRLWMNGPPHGNACAQWIAGMKDWLGRTRSLVARRDRHAALLAGLEQRAQFHRESGAVEPAKPTRDELSDTLVRQQVSDALARIDRIAAPDQGVLAVMERRLQRAERVLQAYNQEDDAAWDRAIASIADPKTCPRYQGLRIRKQLGLAPLRRNQETGLWEFACLWTGDPPDIGPGEKLIVQEATGLVFVLLPGGTFLMGSRYPKDPNQVNTARQEDPDHLAEEEPAHEVTLAPFFLAKHEMTRAEWKRITGVDPNKYNATKYGIGMTNPVENVSWEACERWLSRFGLVLPTEARWEYACRAGTTTVYGFGNNKPDLGRFGNIADRTMHTNNSRLFQCTLTVEDGFVLHAPVGSYEPNAFGLHDMHGNVGEWCLDWHTFYDSEPRPGDGLHPPPNEKQPNTKAFRGGSWSLLAERARSASRLLNTPDHKDGNIGVRPARVLVE